MNQRIRKNKKVSIIYQICNAESKQILMEVSENAPVFYLHGYHNECIVTGLEKALEGRSIGEQFSVMLPCEFAYGPYDKKLVMEVAKEELSPFMDDIWVGGYIENFTEREMDDMNDAERWLYEIESDKEPEGFIIREIRKNTVILDGNHPYAGMDLIFNVKVMSISDASIMELENGYPRESEINDGYNDDDYYFER